MVSGYESDEGNSVIMRYAYMHNVISLYWPLQSSAAFDL